MGPLVPGGRWITVRGEARGREWGLREGGARRSARALHYYGETRVGDWGVQWAPG